MMTLRNQFGRVLLAGIVFMMNPFLASAQGAQPSARQAAPASRIVLLGTAAGPVPRPGRSQPSTLLEIGGQTFLLDAGDGVAQQLARAHVPLSKLHSVFITHLHFDHILGIGPLMAFSWVGGRERPLDIYGPPGLKPFVRSSADALTIGADIFRPELPPRPDPRALFSVHEIPVDGLVVPVGGSVRVRAVANSHYASMKLPMRSYGRDRSLSYRFDWAGHSVVFTGDTGPSAAVEELARDCDILVAEVVDFPSVMRAVAASSNGQAGGPALEAMRRHMLQEHLTPAELGKLAQRVHAGKLVITHFATGPDVDLPTLVAAVREHYQNGEIVLGEDMREIAID